MAFSNTHFSLSLHLLTTLAVFGNPGLSSKELAKGAGTNPSFLRLVIGRLCTAGLVESRVGNGGGIYLARPPEKISVGDIYRAIEGKAQVASHTCPPDNGCPVGDNFPSVMDDITSRIDSAISGELDQITIADLASSSTEATSTN